MYNKVIEINVR